MKTEIPKKIDLKKNNLRDLVKIGESAVESDETIKPNLRVSFNVFESEEKSKKNGILDEFLAPYKERFEELKKSWENLPPQEFKKYAESVSKSLTKKFEQAFDNSSPEQKLKFDKIQHKISGQEDPNKIKLNDEKNSLEELADLGVDLKKLNNKINMMTIINPFSAQGQKTPIKVTTNDGEKEVMIDVKKFAKDAVEYNQKQEKEEAKIPLNKAFELFGKKQFGTLSGQEKVDADKLQASADKVDKSKAIRGKDFFQKVEGVHGIKPPSLSNSNQTSSWRERVGGDSVGGVSKGGGGSKR